MKKLRMSNYYNYSPDSTLSDCWSKTHKMIAAVLFVLILSSLCLNGNATNKSSKVWTATWSTAPQLVEPGNMPPAPGLSNNTLRQVVRVSIGGKSIRVKLSNEFSANTVTLREVQIAASKGGSAIDASTIKKLKFNRSTEVTINPGTAVYSDPIPFNLEPRMDLAITICFGQTPSDLTGHPGSRTTSFLVPGKMTAEPEFKDFVPTDHWYIINGIDVKAPESSAAVAIIGNSITDGRGSGTNRQNRWPDILSERLLKNQGTEQVAVLNLGIGGNCVLKDCLGPSAVKRFKRDILNQQRVRYVIIMEGINDIGQTRDSAAASQVANDLIGAYELMIKEAHSSGLLVYGATLLPFGKSFYYTGFREKARNSVNEWIRNSSLFDGVIDFEKALQNPEDSLTILPSLHTGDYLHPNEAGYKMMGETIDLKLFDR